MPEKRRAVGRPRRDSSKKAKTTVPSPPLKEMSPSEEPDGPLPLKISNHLPLPTIPGDLTLSDRSLRSIYESGVLAASIDRSRQRWLTEGLFEKYWSKPSKKKGWVEDPKNPPRDTMQKVGFCKIIIDPHVLDATVYAIRHPQAGPPPSVPVSLANPIMQYSPSTSDSPAAYFPQSSNAGQTRQPVASFAHQNPPASTQLSPAPANFASASPRDSPSVQLPTSSGIKTQQPATMPSPAPPLPPKQPSQDPVIQMLAHRASTNPELKVLMKIVASGTASGDQLKIFQGHIDDLTSILQREREAGNVKRQSTNTAPPTPAIHSGSTMFHNPATPMPQQVRALPTTFQPPAIFQPPPMKLASQPTPKAEITGVAIEITAAGSSGDRFLFPKNSILEIVDTRQAIASFIVVRKPDAFSAARYKATKEYYQPVTVGIFSEQPKVFDTFAKAFAPAWEVKKSMQETMAKTKRAKDARLALQLPIQGEGGESGERSGPGTPAGTTGTKALDKGLSMSKLAISTSSAGPASTTKVKDKSSTWHDHHCQFCFTEVAASRQKVDEMPICDPCLALRRVDAFKHPLSSRMMHSATREMEPESSGPQNLIL